MIIKSMYLVQTKISSESDFNFSILLRILVQCSLLKFPSFRALRQPRERVLKQVFLMVLWLGLLHTGVALQKKLFLHLLCCYDGQQSTQRQIYHSMLFCSIRLLAWIYDEFVVSVLFHCRTFDIYLT